MTKAFLIALAVLVLPACDAFDGILTQHHCLESGAVTGRYTTCNQPVTRDCWRTPGQDGLTCTPWQPYTPKGHR
jgi:hypothetical protein